MHKLSVKQSSINGRGVYSNIHIKSKKFIAYIDGPKVRIRKFSDDISKNTINWIGTSKQTWINTDNSIFRFINHSCDPNCAIRGERTLYAIKDIAVGDELTIDYSLNESEHDWMIEKCTCGSKNCRGKILPIFKLSKNVFEQKKKFIPKKFQQIFLSYYPHKKI